MTCKMNGHAMSIGYGDSSSIGATLNIGGRYLGRHLRQVPRLTRAEVERLGGLFPSAPAIIPDKPVKEPAKAPRWKQLGSGAYRFVGAVERARIVELYRGGMAVNRIAEEVKRTPQCIRNTLRRAGEYTPDARYGATRARILEAYKPGLSIAEIASQAKTIPSYVATVLVEAGTIQRRKVAA